MSHPDQNDADVKMSILLLGSVITYDSVWFILGSSYSNSYDFLHPWEHIGDTAMHRARLPIVMYVVIVINANYTLQQTQ